MSPPNPAATAGWTPEAPRSFHLLAKPSGSACNIDCTYCFFLSKEALYPGERQRMSPTTLEAYIQQLLEAHATPEVTVAWQGGEPTLMKLEFFRQAVDLVEKHRRPGQVVQHTIQTNGLLLDDDWCAFFKQHNFLVGLSIDGPREMHDAYRRDRRGQGTFDHVLRAWRLLQRHGAKANVVCTVNAANQTHGRAVYCFFRDELGARWIQFIPIVERASEQTIRIANEGWGNAVRGRRVLYTQSGELTTNRSVGGAQYGRFLIDVFEEWVRRDVGTVFVQLFDVTLEAQFDRHLLCIHAPTCGAAPALEHNGDLYSCDHYVEPGYKLGNIHEQSMSTLMGSAQQGAFGRGKLDSLTSQCRACEVRSLCNGGCPKDRFVRSDSGEPGHNYLCPGLKLFFTHVRPAMREMARLVKGGRAPREVIRWVAAEDARGGPYQPCSCGSGKKLRFCHAKPVA